MNRMISIVPDPLVSSRVRIRECKLKLLHYWKLTLLSISYQAITFLKKIKIPAIRSDASDTLLILKNVNYKLSDSRLKGETQLCLRRKAFRRPVYRFSQNYSQIRCSLTRK